MSNQKVLDIWFRINGGTKNYRFRIANPKPELTNAEVQTAVGTMVASRALDFDQSGDAYQAVKAQLTTTNKQNMLQ